MQVAPLLDSTIPRPAAAGRLLCVVLWAGLLLAGCSDEQTVYEVRGVYQGPAHGGQAVRMDHEAIEGLMEAMTMTFRVKDPRVLDGLDRGDKVTFTLVATATGTFIERISPLPDDTPLELAPPQGGEN